MSTTAAQPSRVSGAYAQRARALITDLAQQAADTIGPLLVPGEPVALVDFPNHTNVGDSAIWLGQLSLLNTLGIPRPCYTCDYRGYSHEALSARIGRGTILLSGGGNFGDLYPQHQALRDEVIRAFPNNRIIQLPQSIYFRSASALHESAFTCARHPDLTLLVRDRASFELAQESFRSPVMLCPDLAFCLGPLERPAPTYDGIVYLARRDREARPRAGQLGSIDGVMQTDWLWERPGPALELHDRIRRRVVRYPWLDWLQHHLHRLYPLIAQKRVASGVWTLSRGRAVVTDRLHAHVLSLLMGIPHCVMDNSYGKVRGCYETWTSGAELAIWCDSEAEALERMPELAELA